MNYDPAPQKPRLVEIWTFNLPEGLVAIASDFAGSAAVSLEERSSLRNQARVSVLILQWVACGRFSAGPGWFNQRQYAIPEAQRRLT